MGKNKKDIADLWATKFALERAGVRVVGEEASASDLPDPITYQGEPGDAYLIGTEAPFDMYVFTQPSAGETNFKWFNIGPFPAPGVKGDKGDQGNPGPQGESSRWRFGTVNPVVLETDKETDGYLNTTSGMVYTFDGEKWIAVGSIRGPRGPQGVKGDPGVQGIQGPQGPQGATGPSGIVIEVIGVVANTGSLPDPSTVARNAGYIVDDGVDKDLYIVVEDSNQDLIWYNAGSFTGTPGQAAVISSATATIFKRAVGAVPSVSVTMGGSSSNRTFSFAFYLPLPDGDITNDEPLIPSNENGWTQRVIASKTFKRVITDLSDLGLTAPVTTQQILSALGASFSHTCVMISNDTNFDKISDAPKAKGQLVIIQGTPTRNYDVRYVDDSYNVFIYDGAVGNPEVAQWNRLLTSEDAAGIGTPTGGTTGQILAKKSDDDFDTEWEDVPNAPNGTPAGGSTGQILAKKTGVDYDDEWITPPTGVPDGGSTGQMLVKQSNADGDAAWQTPPVGLPAAGTTGQVLKKSSGTNFDVEWSTPHEVPAGGTTGQVLTKLSSVDYALEWQTPSGGGGGYMPNLLINPDFKINQRGTASEGSGSTAKYCVDRWYKPAGTAWYAPTSNDPFRLLGSVYQYIDNTADLNKRTLEVGGLKLTASILTEDRSNTGSGSARASVTATINTYPSASTVFATSDATRAGFTISIGYDSSISKYYVKIDGNNASVNEIFWAKLEIGENATPYVAPDPATELEKCKRYCEVYSLNGDMTATMTVNMISAAGVIQSMNVVKYITYSTKRLTPTITGTVYAYCQDSNAGTRNANASIGNTTRNSCRFVKSQWYYENGWLAGTAYFWFTSITLDAEIYPS